MNPTIPCEHPRCGTVYGHALRSNPDQPARIRVDIGRGKMIVVCKTCYDYVRIRMSKYMDPLEITKVRFRRKPGYKPGPCEMCGSTKPMPKYRKNSTFRINMMNRFGVNLHVCENCYEWSKHHHEIIANHTVEEVIKIRKSAVPISRYLLYESRKERVGTPATDRHVGVSGQVGVDLGGQALDQALVH